MLRRYQLAFVLAVGGTAMLAAIADDLKQTKPKTTHQNYTETLLDPDGNKITFDMIAVPGGEFCMGSSESEKGRGKDEGPQIKVRLKAFWIGKTEVAWDEYDLYWRLNNPGLKSEENDGEKEAKEEKKDPKEKAKPIDPADAISKPTKPYVDEAYGHERDKHPAICMTQHAAMKYCEWLNIKTGKQYRLPTEAEWEYACRAGTTSPYGIPADATLGDYAWYKGNSADETHPRGTTNEVGLKKPNAWGIHDMHGNVMEWCLDHYVEDAYARYAKGAMDGIVTFPYFKPTENKWWHVARGGHFKDEAKDVRSAARRRSDQKWMVADPQRPQSIWWLTNYDVIGFRIVRPVEDDELKGMTSKVVRENDQIFKAK